MSCIGQWKTRDRGQALPFVVVFIVVLIAFIGLAIDGGLAYVTKAHLSRAVDAASLTASRNYYLGPDTASAVAKSSFAMNYSSWRGAGALPSLDITYTQGEDGVLTNVKASATVSTYFARMLGWKTINIGSSAQSLRNPLIMTLVLDRSQSMVDNNGKVALMNAVPQFIRMFDDDVDHVALVSFANTDRIDVPLRTGFQAPIISAVNGYEFKQGTYSGGGLADAIAENNGLTAQAVPGKPVKVVVFLTDGTANIVQDDLKCDSASRIDTFIPINYGGHDLGGVGFYRSVKGASDEQCWISDGGTPNKATCSSWGSKNGFYCASTRVPSQYYGDMTFTRANVTKEAEYRALQLADQMRAGGMYVYAVGLSDKINRSFLYSISNDKRSPSYNSSLPEGQEYEAPDCKQGGNATLCKAEVNTVFNAIASKVLARLTK